MSLTECDFFQNLVESATLGTSGLKRNGYAFADLNQHRAFVRHFRGDRSIEALSGREARQTTHSAGDDPRTAGTRQSSAKATKYCDGHSFPLVVLLCVGCSAAF